MSFWRLTMTVRSPKMALSAESTIKALEQVLASGRRLILVTGRELPDLESVFPRLDLFERVVAENGALLYHPATRRKRLLAQAPPPEFVDTLRRRGVRNLSTGEVIVAMWRPDEVHAIETIRDLGLELQVIFNKDAVMVLPAGVNKASGLEDGFARTRHFSPQRRRRRRCRKRSCISELL